MDDSYSPSERRGYRRVAIAGVLMLLAIGLLPATAAVLDEVAEDWVLPVYVVVMLVIGALMWAFLPVVVGETRHVAHRALVGACAGLACAAVAMLVFFALLNGYSGA
ncbi:hypothetical protein [Aeromicrobium sp. 179-A 4D2 NHS]|uniref:hypothetical protein n=1 Tax=Aeromicrobium sp. 179-A 4D2 NHS TaxID=3142375 RepID=UPI00399FD5EE